MNGLHMLFHTLLSSSVILYCSYTVLCSFCHFRSVWFLTEFCLAMIHFANWDQFLFDSPHLFQFSHSSSQRQENKKKVQRQSSKHAVKIGTSNMAPSAAGYLATLIRNIIKLWQMAAAPQRIQPALCAYECDINRNVEII